MFRSFADGQGHAAIIGYTAVSRRQVKSGLLAKDTILECRPRHHKCGESASVRGILDFGTVDDTDRLEE
jgi:hypothetical protein